MSGIPKTRCTGHLTPKLGLAARQHDPFGRTFGVETLEQRISKHNSDSAVGTDHPHGHHVEDASGAAHDMPASEAQLAVIDLLGRIAARLDEIADCVKPRARSLSRTDESALRELLPSIATSLKDANFWVHELVAHSVSDVQLKHAIDAALGAAGKLSTRRLGRLLARGEGVTIEGLAVKRLAKTRDGTLWVVKRV